MDKRRKNSNNFPIPVPGLQNFIQYNKTCFSCLEKVHRWQWSLF